MNHTKSARAFFGTNAERTAAGLGAFLPGDEFFETDTEATYQHNGMAWVQTGEVGGASDVDDLTTDTGNSGEMARVAAAGGLEYRTPSEVLSDIGGGPGGSDGQIQYNDGSSFGGFGAWDDSLNQLIINGSTPAFAGTVAEFHDSVAGTSIAIVNESASNDANITATSYYMKNSSESYRAFGYFAVGSVDRTAASEDGYFNISVMDDGTITQKMDIRASLISLNPGEDDTDFRIAGNGVTNGFVYDAGNNRIGIGKSPSGGALDVNGDVWLEGVQIFTGSTGEIARDEDSLGMRVIAATTGTNGASLEFYGRDHASLAGDFFLNFGGYDGTGTMRIRHRTSSSYATRVTINNNGLVSLDSTTGALLLNRLTTTQQNALTGVNGMLIYNSSTNKFRGYASGAWVDLH